MNAQKRVFLLIGIMAFVVIIIEILTISMLYTTAFNEQRARLVETAKSQARLIEAVARFDRALDRTGTGRRAGRRIPRPVDPTGSPRALLDL